MPTFFFLVDISNHFVQRQLHIEKKITVYWTDAKIILQSKCSRSMDVHQEYCQTFSTTRTDGNSNGNQNQTDSQERRNPSKISGSKNRSAELLNYITA